MAESTPGSAAAPRCAVVHCDRPRTAIGYNDLDGERVEIPLCDEHAVDLAVPDGT